MIVVDTSALMAVILGEDDAEVMVSVLSISAVAVGAATVVEASIVAEARGGTDATRELDLLLRACAAEIIPMTQEHVRHAVAAWRRFGKGRHPAGLNLGDCFSYSAATVADAPLLYKGNDFSQTDIRSATGR